MSFLTLADLPISGFSPKLIVPTDLSRMEGRRTESAVFGEAYWIASFQTPFLSPEQMGIIEAWSQQLAGAAGQFLMYDKSRPRPLSAGETVLPDNAGGLATIDTIVDGKTLNISGLPPGFVLSVGDYVEIRQSTGTRALRTLAIAVTADSSGEATLNLTVAINTDVFTSTAQAVFEKPSCVMQIEGDFSLDKAWSARTASFSATEVFL